MVDFRGEAGVRGINVRSPDCKLRRRLYQGPTTNRRCANKRIVSSGATKDAATATDYAAVATQRDVTD